MSRQPSGIKENQRYKMKKRRDQDETGWPPWATILVVAILLGAFIWQAVPRHIIYIGIGLAIVIIGGVSYLVYRKEGFHPFKRLAKKTYESLKASNKQEETQKQVYRFPPLTVDEESRLKDAVGGECENPNCDKKYGLQVHHIIPRAEGGPNKLSNLIVLCQDCHHLADIGEFSTTRLRQWIRPRPERPKRFRYYIPWSRG